MQQSSDDHAIARLFLVIMADTEKECGDIMLEASICSYVFFLV